MEEASDYSIVWVTAPDLKVARDLVKEVLALHLAACAKIIPGIESHYWWQNQLESASECQIVFKTRKALMAALGEVIQAHHPYEVPECVSVAMQEGLPSYLQWIDQETDQSPTNA